MPKSSLENHKATVHLGKKKILTRYHKLTSFNTLPTDEAKQWFKPEIYAFLYIQLHPKGKYWKLKVLY